MEQKLTKETKRILKRKLAASSASLRYLRFLLFQLPPACFAAFASFCSTARQPQIRVVG
jgi:hypothetical protein